MNKNTCSILCTVIISVCTNIQYTVYCILKLYPWTQICTVYVLCTVIISIFKNTSSELCIVYLAVDNNIYSLLLTVIMYKNTCSELPILYISIYKISAACCVLLLYQCTKKFTVYLLCTVLVIVSLYTCIQKYLQGSAYCIMYIHYIHWQKYLQPIVYNKLN